MCLAIPGRVLELSRVGDVLMGKVDFAGISRQICLEHVSDVQPGEYVLVHVGFALARIDEAEAARIFDLLNGADVIDELKAAGE